MHRYTSWSLSRCTKLCFAVLLFTVQQQSCFHSYRSVSTIATVVSGTWSSAVLKSPFLTSLGYQAGQIAASASIPVHSINIQIPVGPQ